MDRATLALANVTGTIMTEKSKNKAPLLRCHPRTAIFLGAVEIKDAAQARRVASPAISLRTHDGACWLWPVEPGFRAKILRG